MLSPRRCAVTAAAVAVVAATAGTATAASPSVLLAKRLKSEMQAFYDKRSPGLKLTTVSCVIAKSHTSAHCAAHFTIVKERAVGVFQVAATIDTATGGVTTRTTSAKCSDAKTGAPVGC